MSQLRLKDAAAQVIVPAIALAFLLCGLALWVGPWSLWAPRVWFAGLVLIGVPVVWRTVAGIFGGRFAADLVASLAILAAILLAQPLAGLVVVLMQTGGEALEHYAAGRASRAVAELEALAPRKASRLGPAGVEEVAAEVIRPGDRLLIRPGDMIPCDGRVVSGHSHVDQSRLTGEPIPIVAAEGVNLMSGSLNQESPLTMEATAPASESQYARIVQLVRSAQETRSPLQRVADRYAVGFTPLTLAVCALAYLISGDPVRVLSVLVVATPCPLILAVPVAMIGGINQAARRRVIIRHGEALERLGRVTVALLDKTGTLTIGFPAVTGVLPIPPFSADQLLGYAAAVDAGAGHMLARSIVQAAAERGLTLPGHAHVVEHPGQGVVGDVDGHEIALGARTFVIRRYPGVETGWSNGAASGLRAWLTVDGQPGGIIEFADRLRPEAASFVARLRTLGLDRVLLVTGDNAGHAQAVARQVGITEVRAELLPQDKVSAVESLEKAGARVLMVGDGTNDAPALSRASVGVALAAHGGGISAEAADVVVLGDDASLVADAIVISRRTLTIARQSIWAGLGLSGLAMAVAAFGVIPPTIGALLQEAIDVAVILNALRASTSPPLPSG